MHLLQILLSASTAIIGVTAVVVDRAAVVVSNGRINSLFHCTISTYTPLVRQLLTSLSSVAIRHQPQFRETTELSRDIKWYENEMKISQNASQRMMISALGETLDRLHPAIPPLNLTHCVTNSKTTPIKLHIISACVEMEQLPLHRRKSLFISRLPVSIADIEIDVIGARQPSTSHISRT